MMEMQNDYPILPSSWHWSNLDNIISFIGSGITPKGGKTVYRSFGIPFIRSQNVYPGCLRLENVSHIDAELHESMTRTHLQPNDVLLNITGASIGRSSVVPPFLKEGNVNQHVCILRLFSQIDPNYISWFLNSALGQKQIMDSQSGVTRQGLNYQQVRTLQIPLAPLIEQHRIVAKIEALFSSLDAGVEALHEAKAQLKRYRQAVLKAAVEGRLTVEWRKAHPDVEPAEKLLEQNRIGNNKYANPYDVGLGLWDLPENWLWVDLGICSELITKGESPKWQGFDYVHQGIPFIRSENVLWGNLDISNTVKIPLEFHKKLKRSVIIPNDVLINLVGASIGRCGVVPASIQEANINQAVAIIRAKSLLLSYYLMYMLISPKMQKQIQRNKVETARPNISLGDLNHLNIPLPPVLEQKQIINEIEHALSISNNLDSILENNLKRINHLRKSILKRAFEGRLIPQDPNDEPASVLLERIKAEKAKDVPRKGRRNNSTRQMRLIQ